MLNNKYKLVFDYDAPSAENIIYVLETTQRRGNIRIKPTEEQFHNIISPGAKDNKKCRFIIETKDKESFIAIFITFNWIVDHDKIKPTIVDISIPKLHTIPKCNEKKWNNILWWCDDEAHKTPWWKYIKFWKYLGLYRK